jgi:hypothetical protein
LGEPRFLILEGDARRLSGPIPPEADGTGAAAWQLVSGNNRELGRSASYQWGPDACVGAIDELVRSLPRAQTRLSRNPSTGLWAWVLTLDGEPVATSARGYRRETEARDSLDHFQRAVPVAAIRSRTRRVVWAIGAVSSPGPRGGPDGPGAGGPASGPLG